MSENEENKTCVLLLNLGGPDSLSAVRPFLYNLFSDREIIRLGPSFMQKPLAYLISSLRHKKTESYYSLIGGRSPIREITSEQALALSVVLSEGPGKDIRVFVGMRYWHPFIEDVVPVIYKEGFRKVIVLSLYPHYSLATTGSSLSKLSEVISGYPIETFCIKSWYDNPLYIEALAEKINKGIGLFGPPGGQVHILFSAHSLPVKFIEEGDPYVEHIKGTINAVVEKTGVKWDLSYQSKSGPVKWLEPSTDEMIESLAERGVRNVLVVPISFVSDHIETLYEIDILYKNMAAKLGIRLERTESLNTDPLFISAMKDLVRGVMRETGWGK